MGVIVNMLDGNNVLLNEIFIEQQINVRKENIWKLS